MKTKVAPVAEIVRVDVPQFTATLSCVSTMPLDYEEACGISTVADLSIPSFLNMLLIPRSA